MELVKFHVCDSTACPIIHRDTIASRSVRIARIEIYFTRSTSRDHDCFRLKDFHSIGCSIKNMRYSTAAVEPVNNVKINQVDCQSVVEDIYVEMIQYFFTKLLCDLPASRVRNMGDSPVGVTSLHGQMQLIVFLIEIYAPFGEFSYHVWSLSHHESYRLYIAEICAPFNGVRFVKSKAVCIAVSYTHLTLPTSDLL